MGTEILNRRIKETSSNKSLEYMSIAADNFLQKMRNFHLPHVPWHRYILGGSIVIHTSDKNNEGEWGSNVFKFTYYLYRITVPSNGSIIPSLVPDLYNRVPNQESSLFLKGYE